jgi:large subunit ribosomal protein L25
MTKHAQLQAQARAIVGNKVKTFARQGLSPAVMYSKVTPSTPLTINTREFLKVYKETGRTGVIDLSVDGKIVPCLVHDLNVHPSKKTLRHVDFLVVNLKEKVIADVPVVTINEAPGVKEFGAVLNLLVDTLEVEALPDEIPEEIQVDLLVLVDFDSTIRISDLPQSKTYKVIGDEDELIANLVEQSQEEETETPQTITPETTNPEEKK